jgi:hypothetical protein
MSSPSWILLGYLPLAGSLSTLTFKQSDSKIEIPHLDGFNAFRNLRQPSVTTAIVSVNRFEPSRDLGKALVARKMKTPINQA